MRTATRSGCGVARCGLHGAQARADPRRTRRGDAGPRLRDGGHRGAAARLLLRQRGPALRPVRRQPVRPAGGKRGVQHAHAGACASPGPGAARARRRLAHRQPAAEHARGPGRGAPDHGRRQGELRPRGQDQAPARRDPGAEPGRDAHPGPAPRQLEHLGGRQALRRPHDRAAERGRRAAGVPPAGPCSRSRAGARRGRRSTERGPPRSRILARGLPGLLG